MSARSKKARPSKVDSARTATKKTRGFSRRNLLRGLAGGAAVAVALPPLEALLSEDGTAFADGDGLPPLYLTWGLGNGTPNDRLVPSAASTSALPITEVLEPLSGVREYINLLSGLTNPLGGGHWEQWCGQVTATHNPSLGDYGDATGMSIDHHLERLWRGQTPVGALHVGISERGYRESRAKSLMSRGEGGARKDAIYQPREVFNQLFMHSGIDVPGADRSRGRSVLRRAVLDAVLQDGQDLRRRLGRADQARLDAHLQVIADLEDSIGRFEELSCDFPEEPTEFGYVANREPLEEKNQVMSDLMVLAFQCGITRIGTFQFCQPQGDPIIWQEGATQGWHILTHDSSSNPETPGADRASAAAQCTRNFQFAMRQLGYLLTRMMETSSGDGNLLDRAFVYITFEMGAFHQHSSQNNCVMTAGRACGALRSGLHMPTGGDSRLKILTTALSAVGEPADSFGTGAGRTTEVFDSLLT